MQTRRFGHNFWNERVSLSVYKVKFVWMANTVEVENGQNAKIKEKLDGTK